MRASSRCRRHTTPHTTRTHWQHAGSPRSRTHGWRAHRGCRGARFCSLLSAVCSVSEHQRAVSSPDGRGAVSQGSRRTLLRSPGRGSVAAPGNPHRLRRDDRRSFPRRPEAPRCRVDVESIIVSGGGARLCSSFASPCSFFRSSISSTPAWRCSPDHPDQPQPPAARPR